jgi:hypothetical protein
MTLFEQYDVIWNTGLGRVLIVAALTAFGFGLVIGATWAARPGGTTGDEDIDVRKRREPRGPQTAVAVEDCAPRRSGVVATLREVK